jgi:hypothetical protein
MSVPLTVPLMAFLAGVGLIIISLLGGGIEIKEIKIPNLGIVPRFLSFILGSTFTLLGIYLTLAPGETVASRPASPSLIETALSKPATQSATSDPSTTRYKSPELRASFIYPDFFSLDNTKRDKRRLYLLDGGMVRVSILRSPLRPDQKDIKLGRDNEKEARGSTRL